MTHFFAYLYRLRFIQRWSLMRNAVPESVAEHGFQVALLVHTLCTVGRAAFGKDVPTERAVTLVGPARSGNTFNYNVQGVGLNEIVRELKAMDRRERLLGAGFDASFRCFGRMHR